MNETSIETNDIIFAPEMTYKQKLEFLEAIHEEIREQRGLPIGEDDFVPSEDDDVQAPVNNRKYQTEHSIGTL